MDLSPASPNSGRLGVVLDQRAHPATSRPRFSATRLAWISALASEMSRVDARGGRRHRVGREARRGQARACRALALEVRVDVALELVGEVLLVRALVVEEGRRRRVAGRRRAALEDGVSLEKSWPISFEPTTLPSRSIIEPSALPGNTTWLTPVMSEGNARPSTTVKVTTAIAAVLSSRMSVELVGEALDHGSEEQGGDEGEEGDDQHDRDQDDAERRRVGAQRAEARPG